uniref:Uncharacterized protein n=1 Tax=Sinocyclocheilus grahami TaxID=75366 RepID=A0A672MIB6_SINGR
MESSNVKCGSLEMDALGKVFWGPEPIARLLINGPINEQSGSISCSEAVLTNRSGDNRGKFRIQSFCKKYGLGAPIASRPKIYQQLAGK